MLFPSITESTGKEASPPTLPRFAQCFPYHETQPGLPFNFGMAIPGTSTCPPTTPTVESEKCGTSEESHSSVTVTSSATMATKSLVAIRTPASTGGTCPGSVTHAERIVTPACGAVSIAAIASRVRRSPSRPTTTISSGRRDPARIDSRHLKSISGRRYVGMTTETRRIPGAAVVVRVVVKWV
jgi:hypothetical protein